MQEYIRNKQAINNYKQSQIIKKSKNVYNKRIPKIGQRQIPTHTFYKTFYNHKNNIKIQIQPMQLFFSESKEYQVRPHKINYDRPVHLLKKYLQRKQKLSYETPSNNKSEPAPQKNIQYKTMHEFRIKKSKRIFDTSLNQPQMQTFNKSASKQSSSDDDFNGFSPSKNLYSMTFQELEESIRWKKQFLDILNRKMVNTKKISHRIKKFE